MKAFAIRDKYISAEKDLAYLLYYEEEKSFFIEVRRDITEWEAPLLISSFVKRKAYSIGPKWSRIWVEQRIVPPDRQNLGFILKENGLQEYDAFQLLVLANGRCSQDECFLVPLKKQHFPDELKERINETLTDVIPSDTGLMLFFRDGMVRETDTIPRKNRSDQKVRLQTYLQKVQQLKMQAGGHGLYMDEEDGIPASELRHIGKECFPRTDILREYLRRNLVTTTRAAELLHCSRQNVLDLVNRGKLQPAFIDKGAYVFLKQDIEARY